MPATPLGLAGRHEARVSICVQFDLRNGSIRKKYDSLKYTVKKLENTLYELSLAEAGFKPEMEADEVGFIPYQSQRCPFMSCFKVLC